MTASSHHGKNVPGAAAPSTTAGARFFETVTDQNSVLVSVVIPAYESARYISQALDSVFAQTFTNYEIIVVNDDSPDTHALEQALHPYRDRICYLKQQNGGPSRARNAAIRQAHGKYVAFLDSDDFWLPDHLNNLSTMLQDDPSLDLVYSDSILLRDDVIVGNVFEQQPQSSPVTFEAILVEGSTITTSSTVVRRQAVLDAGLFDERFKRCEDFDLWLRLSFAGARMNYDCRPSLYHRASNGLAADGYLLKRARGEIYDKVVRSLPLSPSQRNLISELMAKNEADCQVDLAKRFLQTGEYDKALEAITRASTVIRTRKLRLAMFGLRIFPRFFRYQHHAYQRIFTLLNFWARARSGRKLKAIPQITGAKSSSSGK